MYDSFQRKSQVSELVNGVSGFMSWICLPLLEGPLDRKLERD